LRLDQLARADVRTHLKVASDLSGQPLVPRNRTSLRTAIAAGLCGAAAAAGLSYVGLTAYQRLGSIQWKLDHVLENGGFRGDHRHVRLFAIRSQLEQIRSPYDAVVGDSIVEAARLRPICGRPVLNAGIGGATVAVVTRDILPLLKPAPPSGLVIAIGVNDAAIASPRLRSQRTDAFAADFRSVITSAQAVAASVTVATIAPVERGKPLGDAHFDAELIARFNQVIRTAATEHGVPVRAANAWSRSST
jgi:hypothetical protein